MIETLWQANAIKIDCENSFTLTSGDSSPIYIDCRLLISRPSARKVFLELAKHKLEDIDFDILAGASTAGIPYASFLAESLNYPLIYVRKNSKGHGRKSQIEGIEGLKGENVLLIDDLITRGSSKINFIQGIENAGGEVNNCFVILDRKEGGEERLQKKNVRLISLLSLDEILSYGLEKGEIINSQYEKVKEYLRSSQE